MENQIHCTWKSVWNYFSIIFFSYNWLKTLFHTSFSSSRALTMPACSASLFCLFLLVLCGLLGGWVLSVCPSVCSCSRGHRVVDCSSRGLTKLPPGLQHNIRVLNLSFNRQVAANLQCYLVTGYSTTITGFLYMLEVTEGTKLVLQP